MNGFASLGGVILIGSARPPSCGEAGVEALCSSSIAMGVVTPP